MDLAKLENMKFTLNNSYFDLTKTVKDAFETLSYFGNQKSIFPTLTVDPAILPFVKNLYGDQERYTQIMLNFLSNAFKFTPEKGKIEVQIKKA